MAKPERSTQIALFLHHASGLRQAYVATIYSRRGRQEDQAIHSHIVQISKAYNFHYQPVQGTIER
jgi:hypothetical protein